MNNKLHGLISLFLIVAAAGYAAWEISFFSGGWALAYVILSVVMMLAVVYSYCAKCPCRENSCGHIVPGLITRFLPRREQSSYTKYEYAVVAAALGVIFFFPLIWMFERSASVIVYIALYAAAFSEIRLWVCPACGNKNCPLCGVNNLS